MTFCADAESALHHLRHLPGVSGQNGCRRHRLWTYVPQKLPPVRQTSQGTAGRKVNNDFFAFFSFFHIYFPDSDSLFFKPFFSGMPYCHARSAANRWTGSTGTSSRQWIRHGLFRNPRARTPLPNKGSSSSKGRTEGWEPVSTFIFHFLAFLNFWSLLIHF